MIIWRSSGGFMFFNWHGRAFGEIMMRKLRKVLHSQGMEGLLESLVPGRKKAGKKPSKARQARKTLKRKKATTLKRSMVWKAAWQLGAISNNERERREAEATEAS